MSVTCFPPAGMAGKHAGASFSPAPLEPYNSAFQNGSGSESSSCTLARPAAETGPERGPFGAATGSAVATDGPPVNGHVEVPVVAMKSPHPGRRSGRWRRPTSSRSRLAHPEGIAAGDDGDGVMQQAVQERDGGRVFGQEAAPLLERPVARDAERSSFIGRGHEPEQELGAGVVERREAEVVDDHEVGPQQPLDEPADAVVGETPIQRFASEARRRSSGPAARPDGRLAQADERVALAGPRWPDEDEVLVGGDPFERRRGSRKWPAASSFRRP